MSAVVEVQTQHYPSKVPMLMECDPEAEEVLCIQTTAALLRSTEGRSRLVNSNPSGYTQVMESGATIGEAVPATIVEQLLFTAGDTGVVTPEESCPPT